MIKNNTFANKFDAVKAMGMGTVQVKDSLGVIIAPAGYVLFDSVDNETGDTKEVLSFKDGNTGVFYSTMSPTFIKSFINIVDLFVNEEKCPDIVIMSTKSKQGREFFYADIVSED